MERTQAKFEAARRLDVVSVNVKCFIYSLLSLALGQKTTTIVSGALYFNKVGINFISSFGCKHLQTLFSFYFLHVYT